MPLERTKDYYEEEYNKKERSPQEIASEWNTYPNKIRRELIKYGYKLRDKKEAQAVALKSGRHKHPTKGQKRSEEIKVRISEKMAENWKEMGDAERAHRADMGKAQWEAMSDGEKATFRDAAMEAIREAAQDGSKLEKFLVKALRKEGFEVSFHSEHILPSTRLQTDLYVPTHRTVIEIDGPSHFFPIWGQESLDKNILADAKKNALLITYGFVVVRVKHLAKSVSELHKRKLLKEVMDALSKIQANFPSHDNRLIEIELV